MFNHTEWQRKRRRENPERDREYSRQYYWRHKDDPEWREKRRAYLRKYCLLQKEACHANSRKWHQAPKAVGLQPEFFTLTEKERLPGRFPHTLPQLQPIAWLQRLLPASTNSCR